MCRNNKPCLIAQISYDYQYAWKDIFKNEEISEYFEDFIQWDDNQNNMLRLFQYCPICWNEIDIDEKYIDIHYWIEETTGWTVDIWSDHRIIWDSIICVFEPKNEIVNGKIVLDRNKYD